MKKAIVKIVSAATAFLMVAGMAGCSSGAKTAKKSSDTSNTPVTLSIEGLFGVAQDGTQTDAVSKYIAQKTGVTLNITKMADSDSYTQKFNAQVAANDLPDLFFVQDTSKDLPSLVNANEALALDSLVSKYGKNLNADKLAQAMIKYNKTTSPDGKLYTIGLCRGTWDDGSMPIRGNFIRWDLYKKLGYPAIKNLDDLANVLIQMQKLEPKTKDGKKTYALGGTVNSYPYAFLVGEMHSRGLTEGSPDSMFSTDIETNKISSTNMLTDKSSLFYQAFQFCNKLYQAGVFDPDTFTQSDNGDKTQTGVYMLTQESWNARAADAKFKENGTPDKGYMALPGSMFGYQDFSLYVNDIPGERQFGISKTCKYPEKAMELLNFVSTYDFSRIANNGLEGTNWNMKNGKPTPTDAYLNLPSTDTSSQKTGAGYYDHFCGYKSGTLNPVDKASVDCRKNASPLTPVQQDFIQHFGKSTIPDVYKADVKAYSDNTNIVWGTLSDNLKTYETNLITYMEQGETKLIRAKSDADFASAQASFIKGLSAYKVDDIFKYYYDTATKNQEKMKSVYALLK